MYDSIIEKVWKLNKKNKSEKNKLIEVGIPEGNLKKRNGNRNFKGVVKDFIKQNIENKETGNKCEDLVLSNEKEKCR